MNLETTKLIAN